MRIPAVNSLVTFRAAVMALFLTALVSCGESTVPAAASGEPQQGNSEWFGGVDVHHVFFEGIHLADDGVWDIYWGS